MSRSAAAPETALCLPQRDLLDDERRRAQMQLGSSAQALASVSQHKLEAESLQAQRRNLAVDSMLLSRLHGASDRSLGRYATDKLSSPTRLS